MILYDSVDIEICWKIMLTSYLQMSVPTQPKTSRSLSNGLKYVDILDKRFIKLNLSLQIHERRSRKEIWTPIQEKPIHSPRGRVELENFNFDHASLHH